MMGGFGEKAVDVLRQAICDTIVSMKANVQARLDRRSQIALERLVHRLGWSPSRVVREGVHLLAACYGGPPAKRVIGFASGLPDLGSNKKHLRWFGQ
jgi:hypothetical protein